MKIKKMLRIGLPFLGLSAIAVVMPVTLTSCTQKDNTNYISMDQAQANQLYINLGVTLSALSNEEQISTTQETIKQSLNMPGNKINLNPYVSDVKITLLNTSDSQNKKQAKVTITLKEGYSVKVLNGAQMKFDISKNVLTSSSPYSTGISTAQEQA